MDNGILCAIADDDEETPLLLLEAIANQGGDTGVTGVKGQY